MDAVRFRETMAQWASGVTVVTTVYDGKIIGITASSFTSVSADPPTILVCVAKKLYTHQVIKQSQVFAVNILHTAQLEWGLRFAGMIPEISDRFAGIEWAKAVTGSPVLPDVMGWLDCRLLHSYDGGDHTIFVGEVAACGNQDADLEPLLYYNRQWRQLAMSPVLQP
jgi:flavin reductase (DIM6/NTAB) family NADH-FMN oxidoreductase RutF